MLKILLLINFLVTSNAISREPEEAKSINRNLDKELLKKYGSYRPKEVLYLKDSMSIGERVDLDNEYFKISYPKCFKVEPTVEDSDDVNIKNSASIDLIRTKRCNMHKLDEDLNRMQLFYMPSYEDPNGIEAHEPASKAAYRQMIDVGGETGVLYWGAGISPEWDHHGELISGWSVAIGCKGKKNELFRFSIRGQRNEDVVTVFKNKKFALPEDFQQIISSFRCRKDR